ncbi:hypothetical protein BH11BAC1_BH11BAC1_03100 [soil metagenome]
MADIQDPLLPSRYYHIYNHAVGKENFFETDSDYLEMLSRMEIYLLPVCHILTYTLMPNHFHFDIQVKSNEEISEYLIERFGEDKFLSRKEANENFVSGQVSRHFANLFSSYAKHYNFIKDRIGTLFKRAFRRAEITDLDYFKTVINYVHQNPVEAGFVHSMKHWKYSSYNLLTGNEPTFIARKQVIELFGGIKNFHGYHLYKSGLN